MTTPALDFQKTCRFSEDVMARVTVRQRNQLTIPPEAVVALGVNVGDVGEATVQGNALIVRFRTRESAQRALAHAYGSAAGVWGTSHEETEDAIERDRASWNREGI